MKSALATLALLCAVAAIASFMLTGCERYDAARGLIKCATHPMDCN